MQMQRLFRQVELLKAEDEAIECDLEKLGQTMSRMAEHLPKLEPDEAKARTARAKLNGSERCTRGTGAKARSRRANLVFRGVQPRTRWRGLS